MPTTNTPKFNSAPQKQFVLLLTVLVLFSCKQTSLEKKDALQHHDTIVIPATTKLLSLPNSLQPKKVWLKDFPSAKSIPVTISSNNVFKDASTKQTLAAEVQGNCFFTNYTSDNGLSIDAYHSAFKDSKGNLWFASNGGGVSKYDGYNFINYTSSFGLNNGNVVWCVYEDSKGNLWFGTDGGGVSKYDGYVFTNYTKDQGLIYNIVHSIKEDSKGNLWFGTEGGGVSKYNGVKFENFTEKDGLINNTVRSIEEDDKGNLWFGTMNGVSIFNGQTFANYSKKDGLIDNTVSSINVDEQQNIWIATKLGVNKYNGSGFTNYTQKNGLVANDINFIYKDSKNNLWFAASSGGVTKFDGNRFINFTTAQGLINTDVRSVVEDNSGNIWMATYGNGIIKYNGKSFSTFSKKQNFSNSFIYAIAQNKSNNLWFGSAGDGLYKYDGETIQHIKKENGLPSNTIWGFVNDTAGNMWIATQSGLCKYDGKNFTNYTKEQGLFNSNIFSIEKDRKGNIWLGTNGNGLIKYDGESFTNYTTAQGLAGNIVYSIKEDSQGNIWIGTFKNGVSKFDGSSFTNYTTQQGLGSNSIWNIYEDDEKNIWFATAEGLSKLNTDKKKAQSSYFETFTVKDGLPDNFITQIIQEKEHQLLVGTNLGFCEFIFDSSTGRWKTGAVFNSKTGFPVKDVNSADAMFKDTQGIIWIGTGSENSSLVRFDPSALFDKQKNTLQINIRQIKLNNETVCWSDVYKNATDSMKQKSSVTEEALLMGRTITFDERSKMQEKFQSVSFDSISKWNYIPSNLILPYDFNTISFQFNAIETGQSSSVQYQYKLEGYDKDWNKPINITEAVYGNLYEGNYVFKIRARYSNGSWSEPVSYSFKVLPPWYRKQILIVLYVLMIIVAVYLIILWNSRRLIAQKKILQQKVDNATHQLREEKNTIEIQKQQIEQTLSELKATQSQLIQSEKMASLGELTAGIAHEIQNPLNFVNNFSEVSSELVEELKEELSKGNNEEAIIISNDVKENLQKINHHGQRAASIIKGMLQHSRNSTGQKEPTDINALCDECLRLAYHGFKAKAATKDFDVRYETDFDSSVGKINIQPQEFSRVILNLINNAFYEVSEKQKREDKRENTGERYEPTVTVSTKLLRGENNSSIRQSENSITICIKDNGSGIPQKILDKIFQPFFTTKPTGEGTGLGLSLSYDIITKGHGGELKVETKDGEGTTFIIQIPTP